MVSVAEFVLEGVIRPDGVIETARLSEKLRISKQELAAAAGLSRDAVSKTTRLYAPSTQSRLRDMIEIIPAFARGRAPCLRHSPGTGRNPCRHLVTRRQRIS